MKPNPNALLIDHDRADRRLVRLLLESEHYHVFETEDGRRALAMVGECKPDVIILEWSLPDLDGLTVLKRLRRSNQIPMLVLSACDDEADTVAALDAGANGYMTKPFSGAELLARLRVLRRCQPGEFDEPVLVEGELTVDLSTHAVTFNHRKLNLTPTEEALFYLLVRHTGKVVTRSHLLRCVWGTDEADKVHALQVYVATLRGKLGALGGEILIRTEGRIGYRLSLATPHDQIGVANGS